MKKLHIAYISIPALGDCDLPLLREMSQWADVDYYLPMTGKRCQSVIFDVEVKRTCNLNNARLYPELEFLKDWISLDRMFIMNMPAPHDYSPGNLKVIWQTIKKIRRGKYDLVHVTLPLRYGFYPLYVFRNKMVMTMHDPIPHSGDFTRRNLWDRWVAFKVVKDYILLNKNQIEEFSKLYGIDKKHIYLSHLSIYTHLKKIPLEGPLVEKPYVLFFGSIQINKGIEYLCEAMKVVIKERPNMQVVIAGKGNFYFDNSTYKKNPNYHFINRFITDREQVSLMTHSMMVICPYIDATQSGVMMSAFGLDKPVIATDVGGLGEMFEDGKHGLLVKPKDVKGLAKAIIKMSDAKLLKHMSDNIKNDFNFGKNSWVAISQGLKEIYMNILG